MRVTLVRLGYVAMSVHLQNCSPSQTMTFAQFQKIKDREAAIRKLERIAISNLKNCLRLLKHNVGHDIEFFRFSSRLIPLANHEELADWRYMRSLKEPLQAIQEFLKSYPMRVDFHPDHFVLLNSPNPTIIKQSIKTLSMHHSLLRGMGVDHVHRCVLHIGGGYGDKEKALEQFIHNWSFVPNKLQEMVMLENDDTTFALHDTLYLCEKLGIPIVFDLHHHLVNHENRKWQKDWDRIVQIWKDSPLPMKMHISSPKNEKNVRAHADFVDVDMFVRFLTAVKGSVEKIDCMIEAKMKDEALFRLIEDLKRYPGIEMVSRASIIID
jgi:UV DNA damage endonuclease